VLEAVPNVSEGRDPRTITAVGEAFARRVELLDVHSDPDHHRSVFTLVGAETQLVDALLEGIAVAVERIDLRRHHGVHPRVGVADVVPVVPLRPDALERAKATAREVASGVGEKLGIPVFLYGEVGDGRRPAFFRHGGLDELSRRVGSGELVPDAGPRHIDLRSGAVLVGARRPLVAYNLVLGTDDVAIAKEIARTVRESGGGLPGVQAIGIHLPASDRVQVSMNVLDLECSPLHLVVERVRREAAVRGVEVVEGELVGLVPQQVVRAAAEAGVEIPGVDSSRTLEHAVGSRLGQWPGRSS
jgi:glutamate formiminotransferase